MRVLQRRPIDGVSGSRQECLVSIVCLTFNQEKYIEQTLESFLAQKTSFRFEIVVHDDASSDNTPQIVRKYQALYPDRITLLLQTDNLYSRGGHVPAVAIQYASGQFIAYCEGDDYWCDPDKLQRQADFLSRNLEHGVVFTNAKLLYESSGLVVAGRDRSQLADLSPERAREVLLLGNPYTACTSMFRAEAIKGYEHVARKLRARVEDLVMWLFIAERYRFGFLSDVTAVYRVHARSASHFQSLTDLLRFERSAHRTVSYFNKQFGYILRNNQLRARYRRAVTKFCLTNGYYWEALRFSRRPVDYLMPLFRSWFDRRHSGGNVVLHRHS